MDSLSLFSGSPRSSDTKNPNPTSPCSAKAVVAKLGIESQLNMALDGRRLVLVDMIVNTQTEIKEKKLSPEETWSEVLSVVHAWMLAGDGRENIVEFLLTEALNDGCIWQAISPADIEVIKTAFQAHRDELAKNAQDKSDSFVDFPHLKLMADNGDAEASFKVGMAYLTGTIYPGVEKNLEDGLLYLKQAAEKGHVHAVLAFGRALAQGMIYPGIEKDSKNGLDYLKLAAKQGDPEVLFELGKALVTGKVYSEIRQNLEEGIYYLTLAANKGNPEAMLALQEAYFDNRQYANGIHWLTTLLECKEEACLDCFKIEALKRLVHIYSNGVANQFQQMLMKADAEKARKYSEAFVDFGAQHPDLLCQTAGLMRTYVTAVDLLKGKKDGMAKVIEELEKAVIQMPSNDDAYAIVDLYRVYLQSDRHKSIDRSIALTYYEQARKLAALENQKEKLKDIELAKVQLTTPAALPTELWAKVSGYFDPTLQEDRKAIRATRGVSHHVYSAIDPRFPLMSRAINLNELTTEDEKACYENLKNINVFSLRIEISGIDNQHRDQFGKMLQSLADNPHRPLLWLKLTGSGFRDEEFTAISKLSTIVSLEMPSCDLRHTQLKFLQKLPQLRVLDLTRNFGLGKEAIGILSAITTLTELRLGYCSIHYKKEKLAQLRNLKVLHIEQNLIVPGDINTISGMTHLTHLHISDFNISIEELDRLSKSKNLSHLYIEGKVKEKDCEKLFNRLVNLKELHGAGKSWVR